MPEAVNESAAEVFVSRYSVPKLLVGAAICGALGGVGLFLALSGEGAFTLLVGGAGTLMFGGGAAIIAAHLFDRRPQVIIDSEGLYVRSHGETRIALRAIRRIRIHAPSWPWTNLAIFLFKPAKYPIETRHRRFIWRIGGSGGSGGRDFSGDVWIGTSLLDQPVDAVIRAIYAHRPMTEFEKQVWALVEDADPGVDSRAP